MMIDLRFFLVLPFVLAACEQQRLVDASLASQLNVVDVVAGTTVTRTDTALPKDQIVATVESTMESVLVRANPGGARKVRANVVIDQFYIANAGAGLLLGSSSSLVATTVTLVDAVSGAPVSAPFKVGGTTEARPTVFGALAIKPPAQELATIASSAASNAKIAIYGK